MINEIFFPAKISRSMVYVEMMSTTHVEFEVEATGLHVNPKYPYLGASPDGLVMCACCGNGLLEVKCPYSVRRPVTRP